MASAIGVGEETSASAASAPDVNRNKPWHRRPTITPNFGKRQKIGLKSNVSQVLLHDNVSQQQLLEAQLNSLRLERERTTRLLDLHRKAFLVQQSIKQHHLRATGITHVSLLPDSVARALGPGSSSKRRPPLAREVTFVLGDGVDVGVDENNNNADDDDDDDDEVAEKGSAGSTRSDGRSTRYAADTDVDDPAARVEMTAANSSVGLPPSSLSAAAAAAAAASKALHARSHSAAAPVEETSHFLTHDYHLRRERTALGPVLLRTEPLQQRKARTLRALKDPRFVSLRKALVPSSKPVDGYLQLSASGQYVLQRYGTPSVDRERIQKLIQEMTWIRKSRQRLRSSADSAVSLRSHQASASEGQKFPVDRLVINHDSDGVADTYEGN